MLTRQQRRALRELRGALLDPDGNPQRALWSRPLDLGVRAQTLDGLCVLRLCRRRRSRSPTCLYKGYYYQINRAGLSALRSR